ncbi:MAG: tetratricopeptide repeat protein [Myxococcales bacterium]|nr:tetratricopeptide repeat protein [Myxococcales bacterium]MCB9756172.1 tetratricopeptide repeat protein [Myxococcales bacterium]
MLSGTCETTGAQNSFCVTLHEALYGARPFAGDSLAELRVNITRGIRRPPPPGAGIPGHVAAALRRGLSVDPDARWASMDALLERLTYQPPNWRRRGLSLALGLTAVGASGYAVAISRAPAPCGDIDARLEGVWDEARRMSIADAFARSSVSYAADLWPRVRLDLHEYADAWTGALRSACQSHVAGELSDASYDQQHACLERRRAALDVALRQLADADAEIVENAPSMVGGLPPPERCHFAHEVAYQFSAAPEVVADAERLRSRVSELEVVAASGKVAEAHEGLKAIEDEVRGTGHLVLLAEYALARRRVAESQPGDELPLEGLDAALRAGDDLLAAELSLLLSFPTPGGEDVYLRLARSLTLRLDALETPTGVGVLVQAAYGQMLRGDLDGALTSARRVVEIADALPEHGWLLRAQARSVLAEILTHHGQHHEARAQIEQALALHQEHEGETHPGLFRALETRARAELESGHAARALDLFDQALELHRRAWGGQKIDGDLRHGRAYALDELGRFDEAIAEFEAVIDNLTRAGVDDIRIAEARNSLGVTLDRKGEHARAVAELERARGEALLSYGPDHPVTGAFLMSLADAELHLGNTAEARKHFERAREIWSRAGPGTEMFDYARNGLGLVALAEGDYTGARALLEEVLVTRVARGSPPVRIAATQLGLARAMHHDGPSLRPRACSLAADAKAAFAEAGPGYAREHGEVASWARATCEDDRDDAPAR